MKQVQHKQETPVPVPAIRILKIAFCPTLSGKSTLTYHIGCVVNGESICTAESEIHFRIYANDGGGFFSNEWISLDKIQQVFAKVPADKSITSFILHSLFRGKSVNTPAFLLAVLKQEGLVSQSEEKQRQYGRIDPVEFIAGVNKLIATDVDLKVEDKSSKVDGKPEEAHGKKIASISKPKKA